MPSSLVSSTLSIVLSQDRRRPGPAVEQAVNPRPGSGTRRGGPSAAQARPGAACGAVSRRRRSPAPARGPGRCARRRCAEPRRAAPRTARTSRRPAATSSIVPTSTRFMWRMNVSASIQNSSSSPLHHPLGREHLAHEAHVLGLGGREGGEVVAAQERARALVPARRGRARRATSRRGRARTRCGCAAPARGSSRCGCGAWRRASKPSGAGSLASTAMSAGSSAFRRSGSTASWQ